MTDFIHHNGNKYPKFQGEGFASKFAIPYAEHVLTGNGIDIGCNRPEWAYPHSSLLIDPAIDDTYHATNIPNGDYDYIFSSHLLEHLDDWVGVLQYWRDNLKVSGKVFLYLPNSNDQSYWRPWFNRKHVNYFTPEIFKQYFADQPALWTNYYVSGTDANSSFISYATKA